MRLEYIFPREIEKAKKERTPLVIPVGTIEYHGPHCAFGCDTFIAMGVLERLSQERELIMAPPVWYGPSSYAVAGDEAGTVHVDVDVFEENIYHILRSFLYGGWRNIYVLIHHQYEQENLLPMTLSCMKAAKKLTFKFLEETRGIGWWGQNENRSFYEELDGGDNPWDWITVLPVMSKEVQEKTGYDHAGKWECSILSALYPETVDLSRMVDSDEWFIQDAVDSSQETGEKMIELCVEDLKQKIK
ncbi:MAG TPA: creatininase family protein [Firmicutes bacterium]|jgi:creatinine amidohydrolase|nr:creatininase family protein [Bacillota bacterium]